ncbi:MAG: DUF4976 domain-containing protein, partial [Bradyrhizobium sp.]|uniref:sulfatase/phosphatase domain-containing protein n=1 Tax=Bradyrhizobium sp. TaxID=376 RepID=UPI0025BF05B0
VRSENYGFGMFRTQGHKLVVFEETRQPVQLFDLVLDPDENHNVVDDPTYAGVLSELMRTHVIPFLNAARPPSAPRTAAGVQDAP